MRIIAGAFRGRPLMGPPGRDTRPTADRARQAIFNVLEHAAWGPPLEGARVIDLFAGSGALGLEALSRGASACLLVDNSAPARATIRQNAAALGALGDVRIEGWDAARLPARPAGEPSFDLAFLDPPYESDRATAALRGLAAGDWLRPGAILVLEEGKTGAPLTPDYAVLDERRWGAARVLFLKWPTA